MGDVIFGVALLGVDRSGLLYGEEILGDDENILDNVASGVLILLVLNKLEIPCDCVFDKFGPTVLVES